MRSIRRILFSVLFLFSVFGEAKTCLFRVTDGSRLIYLLGSVHVLRASDYPLPVGMENAYAISERIIFELHPDSAESPTAQMRMLQVGSLSPGKTLRDLLSDSVYARLAFYSHDLGLNLDLAQGMKPWMVGTFLTLAKMGQKGILPEFGVDRYFYRRARAEGKTVFGLETVSFQLSLFDSLSSGNPDAFLTYLFREWESFDSASEGILHAWREGDLGTLSTFLMESFSESPDLYRTLILRRNQAWVDRILGYAGDGRPTLVIVGAAHLAGPDGLLSLFEVAGFTVEPL